MPELLYSKKISLFDKKSVFIGFIIIFFITDSLNLIVDHYPSNFTHLFFTPYLRLSAYSKGIVFLLMIIYQIVNKELIFNYVIIYAVFGINYLLNINEITSEPSIMWTVQFVKLLFPFLLFDYIKHISRGDFFKIHKILRIIWIVQVIAVATGIITGSELFLTYNNYRFGYKGLFVPQNEATFFYIISCVLEYKIWKDQRKKIDLFLLIAFFIASVILGSKTSILFLVSFLGFIVWDLNLKNKKHKKYYYVAIGVIVLIIISIMLSSGLIQFYVNLANDQGWLYMITSKRSDMISTYLVEYIRSWNFFNYLLGGCNSPFYFVEMDVVDIFVYSGIIGTFVYLWYLFRQLFLFSKHNKVGWFLVFQFFLIGGLAGHVFASGINAIYLVILCYYLQLTDPVHQKQNIHQETA